MAPRFALFAWFAAAMLLGPGSCGSFGHGPRCTSSPNGRARGAAILASRRRAHAEPNRSIRSCSGSTCTRATCWSNSTRAARNCVCAKKSRDCRHRAAHRFASEARIGVARAERRATTSSRRPKPPQAAQPGLAQEAPAAVEFARDHERRLREESAVGGVAQIEALRARTETQKLVASREALRLGSAAPRDGSANACASASGADRRPEAIDVSLQGDAATIQATIARLGRT